MARSSLPMALFAALLALDAVKSNQFYSVYYSIRLLETDRVYGCLQCFKRPCVKREILARPLEGLLQCCRACTVVGTHQHSAQRKQRSCRANRSWRSGLKVRKRPLSASSDLCGIIYQKDVICQQARRPRSCVVEMENGVQIERNRKMLVKQTPSRVPDTYDESNEFPPSLENPETSEQPS
ncbi:hypothetical protein HPB51_020975 [Rhipicephalus microplus]|uniref:Uncharacterized protein n=1 Tax=Rhipicephalus microplus TaxID=6941 RepID=A0A9J6DW65_RHIMP|nr:hypothetical protein HPB51_020975 [Rhipicephalus microplus]